MHDAMGDAAQRQFQPVDERNGLRQALQARRDPAAIAFREGLRFFDAAAQRHGEHDRAACRLYAQRVAPRLPVATQLHGKDRPVERDLDQLRIGWAAEQKRAQRHKGSSSGNRPRVYRRCHPGRA